MRLYERKNRKTKLPVWLCRERDLWHQSGALWIDWYWCECTHGNETRAYSTKTQALNLMAHPNTWCEECAAIVKAKEEHRGQD